jgi:hypothetical protein
MDQSAHLELIQWVGGSIMAIICIGFIVFGVNGAIVFNNTQTGASKSFGPLFSLGNSLRVITILAAIIAFIFFSLRDNLDFGAVVLLSATAGFVLGGSINLIHVQPPRIDEEVANKDIQGRITGSLPLPE